MNYQEKINASAAVALLVRFCARRLATGKKPICLTQKNHRVRLLISTPHVKSRLCALQLRNAQFGAELLLLKAALSAVNAIKLEIEPFSARFIYFFYWVKRKAIIIYFPRASIWISYTLTFKMRIHINQFKIKIDRETRS